MLKKLALISLVTVVFASSCRKSDRQEDTDTQSTVDYLQAQTYFINTGTVVFDALRNRPEIFHDADTSNHYTGSCPAYTVSPAYPDSTTYPKTIILDYGTSNCTGSDGFKRRGKLRVILNSNPQIQGSQITISPEQFYINDKEVRGGISLVRQANSSSGNAVYKEVVSDGEVHVSSSAISYFRETLTRERISGDTTLTTSDDQYKFSGAGSGYATRGTNYTYTIKSPYISKPLCAYIDNGSAALVPGNLSERFIDLGSGCNSSASVQIFEITSEVGFD